jgi:hypothetical protein
MGAIVLWAILVMDGNEVFVQERFETEEACMGGAQAMEDIGRRISYTNFRYARCVDSTTGATIGEIK